MVDSAETSFSLSSLLCQEDETCLNQSDFESKTSFDSNPVLVFENEDEYIENLVEREAHCFGSKGFAPFATGSWLRSARLDSIEWIFNTGAVFGFQLHTAYLSLAYFDGFLSKLSIDVGKLWAIRLLSVACLSLAAKMEECEVPALSEFQVQDYHFKSKDIQKMELLVLNTLEWKLGSITPFAYLHYFISKFCAEEESNRPNGLVSRAVGLIVAMAKEIDLINTRPSIIAAAAVLSASGGQQSRNTLEIKMGVVTFFKSQDYEPIHCCYNLMQKMVGRNDKTPPKFSSICPSVLTIHSSSMDVLENSVGTKRRLTFSDCSDQSCPTKKFHQG